MYNSDEIINNVKKLSEKYQEIMLYFMQGKGNILPPSLFDADKNRDILTSVCKQFTENPEKFWQINTQYAEKFQGLVSNSVAKFVGSKAAPIFAPLDKDKRFKDVVWQDNTYFDFIKQFYLMSSEWLQKNVEQYELIPELKKHLEFTTKQFIDAFSPSNFAFYNPLVLRETLESGGQNLVKGVENFLEDIKSSGDILNIRTTDKSAFKLGSNIATSRGKVVIQNQLMQLICYEPKKQTYAIPILIIPPCINKYYILDLSPYNSMVAFLIENNFQVFMVSWVNPDAALANKSFEDYIQDGILEPCEYIMKLGYKKINCLGYCIGGTFLATAMAYLKAKNLDYINSATFLTTLLDYEHPGEVGIFINEASIAGIEQEMDAKGYFDGRYLSNSFSLLRANDLVWSFFVNNYLLGKTPLPFDLLYWNADPTNLPSKMHSYYLRNMYLNNLLKEAGKLSIFGIPIDLGKIDCNSFFLAANQDHIAPWRSVYDSIKLLNGQKTFCLTNSGHVAGVVNPPIASKYNYKTNDDLSLNSESWFIKAAENQGSWWPYWLGWLKDNSKKITKSIDYQKLEYIELAPGGYVSKSI